jgi:ABC-type branched-subunit amino acid transport system ATPase component
MAILKIKNLQKHFGGVMAIDGLSVSFEKARVTSVIGPNGSGKTTLVNVLSAMLNADGGIITISDGPDLRKCAPFTAHFYGITRTFQEVRLFEQMSVLDNVLIVLTERNVLSAIFEKHGAYHLKQAKEALETAGLWSKRTELATNLSYGQRKLLEVARVLALTASGKSNIILFDEPFAGLFPQMVKTVANIIKELRKAGKTIVLIEHNMDLIRELSDHVIVMDAGKLLAEGEPEEVLSRKDVIEAYLGE